MSEQPMEPQTPLDSARQWINDTRRNIISGHGWTSGIFDCCSDCKSCWVVMVCGPTVTGQLFERVYSKKWVCATLATILWLCAIGNFWYSWLAPPCGGEVYSFYQYSYDENSDGDTATATPPAVAACKKYNSSPWPVLGALAASTIFLLMCFLTAYVRHFVRTRDSIPPTIGCGILDDLVCGGCCTACVQCQIMRHEGLTERYKLVSPDGVQDFQTSSRYAVVQV